ncbi:uncharacterized protein LAESUDRAFT_348586 [Laetiporus sulphureus 93-53]|uniref:Plasma membrane fusion protein PRM1 n=1 Tax=Laetiporus sulphureus 93-53 TaxID=1314785 RepID=A0A165GSS9_9APHY|nr:uncharacterized protein LAESUDRAFT_348586 [Laetiporus sulphureus 93-53]KZT10761.1 hypothetical protein LAESUDRAFT_348586 [Laetiporus sulphureus 93-53]
MSHDRWNSPPPGYGARSSVYSSTALKPYLELPHLLSLTWLAYPILSLLFVAFRLKLSADSAQDSIASAKDDLLTACNAAQKAATSAASMPRYLALNANDHIADAVNDTMDLARDALTGALTVMEAIINFIVDTYRSTFLCFLELVVRGALDLLIGAVEEINTYITSLFSGIRTAIQGSVEGVNDVIQEVADEVSKLKVFGNLNISNITIPELSELENVTLPTTFQDALQKLNSSLPTLSQLKSDIDDLIDTPFELVKKEINETFASLYFNKSVLPVPQQNSLSFCDDMDTSWVDDLGQDLVKIAEIGIAIIIVIAVLLIAANCMFEWYKWRLLKRHLQRTREAWMSDPAVYNKGSAPMVDMSDHNLLILAADSQHPHLMKIANAMSTLFRLGPSQYINLRWFLHYVFHPPALACFLIGFFGLLSVEIQLAAVRPLADKFSDAASESVSNFTSLIATNINSSMYNESSVYASTINARVDAVQSSLNGGLFGWIDNTTSTLNATINNFYDDLQDAIQTVFNGTVLESPIEEFIKCFIGGKVNDIEEALTWLHDNLNVNLPTVNESALVLSPSDIDEITTPIAGAAMGSGDGDDDGIVGDIVNAYIKSLKEERLMFGIFMALWGVVVLMALCILFWYSYGRNWVEAYNRRRWRKTQREGLDTLVIPVRENSTHAIDREWNNSMQGMQNPGRYSEFGEKGRDTGSSSLRRAPSVRNPEYEKSWDSYLDHAYSNPPSDGAAGLKISRPMKLMPTGKERSGGDAEDRHDDPQSDAHRSASWSMRLKGLLPKHGGGSTEHGGHQEQRGSSRYTRMLRRQRGRSREDIEDWVDVGEDGSMRERARPSLMINTSYASSTTLGDLPEVELPKEGAGPVSAWSTSPGTPPRMPWMNAVFPTVASKATNPYLRSKSTNADHAAVDSHTIGIKAPTPQVPVPLYHGFQAPPETPSARLSMTLLPPPVHPSRKEILVDTDDAVRHSLTSELSPFSLYPQQPTLRVQSSIRLVTITQARQPSLVDPFVTPFDDENRVRGQVSSGDHFADFSERTNWSTNPFIATSH